MADELLCHSLRPRSAARRLLISCSTLLALVCCGVAPGCRAFRPLKPDALDKALADDTAKALADDKAQAAAGDAANDKSQNAPPGAETPLVKRNAIPARKAPADEAETSSPETLEKLLRAPGEVTRAAAVAGLAKAGRWESVERAAADKSWRVRRTVAVSLSDNPSPARQRLAIALVLDRSVEVQQAVVRAVDGWPLNERGPVLLTALSLPTYRPRKMAAEQLAAAWPEAKQFDPDAAPDKRAAALAPLQQQWRKEHASSIVINQPAAKGPESKLDEAQLERITDLIERMQHGEASEAHEAALLAALKALGPALIPALDTLVCDRGTVLPESVQQRVLPQLDARFVPLAQLGSALLAERRGALLRLIELSAEGELPPLMLERVASRIAVERDPVAWQSALRLVERDGREVAGRIAAAGLGHPTADVRRRACEHLAAHPRDEHTQALLATVTDESAAVAAAAAKALERLDGERTVLRE